MAPESTEIEPLLTPEQTAATLAVKPATLAAWRCVSVQAKSRPALPFVKVGDLVRYRPSDVQAFIQQSTRIAA